MIGVLRHRSIIMSKYSKSVTEIPRNVKLKAD